MASLVETRRIEAPSTTMPDQCMIEEPDRVLELLPVAVCVCDRDGLIIRYNRRAADLWGHAPRLGDPAERFCGSYRLHRPDGALVPHESCPMAEVLRTGGSVRGRSVVIERTDGSRVAALVDIDAIKDASGSVIGAINCFRETAEIETGNGCAQVPWLDRERRPLELLQALPAAVYTTDSAGRITFFNEAAAELWGHRPEISRSEWCGSWHLYWPDGRPMAHDECPMAIALKEGRAIRGAEAVAERPDGTRVPFLAFPTPLRDSAGAVVGAVNMLVDIAERKHTERAGHLLAAIVESSDDAIVSKDLDGIIATWNRGAERLFGYSAEEIVGKPIATLIPGEHPDEGPDILRRIRRGERIDHYETLRRRKDGSLVEISLTVSPIKDATGRIIGASKIARDITERKRAQEQQRILLREMNHRVKNLFALAGGVVALSARSARSAKDLAGAVRERLDALSKAHDLTLPSLLGEGSNVDRATTLPVLVRTIISPYIDPIRDQKARIVAQGPDVSIRGGVATSMALLLHEFATNAAKYGALSSPRGRVAIDWTVEGSELRLSWREQGGPRLDGPPEREGFGTLLARATVTGQLDGRIVREWKPEGLFVLLTVPMDSLAN